MAEQCLERRTLSQRALLPRRCSRALRDGKRARLDSPHMDGPRFAVVLAGRARAGAASRMHNR